MLRERHQVFAQMRLDEGAGKHSGGFVNTAVIFELVVAPLGIGDAMIIVKTFDDSDDGAVGIANGHGADVQGYLVAAFVAEGKLGDGRPTVAQHAGQRAAEFADSILALLFLGREEIPAKMSQYILAKVPGNSFRP